MTKRVSGSEESTTPKTGKQSPPPNRKPGALKGKIWISPDFDKPDLELEALFYDGPVEPAP